MGCGASAEDSESSRRNSERRRSSHRPSSEPAVARLSSEDMSEEEQKQVEAIMARRPKQSILSTNTDSLTRYKSATFHIDDDDTYYSQPKEVKLRDEEALRRTNSVLKPSAKVNGETSQSDFVNSPSMDSQRNSSSFGEFVTTSPRKDIGDGSNINGEKKRKISFQDNSPKLPKRRAQR